MKSQVMGRRTREPAATRTLPSACCWRGTRGLEPPAPGLVLIWRLFWARICAAGLRRGDASICSVEEKTMGVGVSPAWGRRGLDSSEAVSLDSCVCGEQAAAAARHTCRV